MSDLGLSLVVVSAARAAIGGSASAVIVLPHDMYEVIEEGYVLNALWPSARAACFAARSESGREDGAPLPDLEQIDS